MRETFGSGKKDEGKPKYSIPAKVFGAAVLATGLALCPMKDAKAEDSVCKQEFKFLKLINSEKRSDTLFACFEGLKKQTDYLSVKEKCFCLITMDLIIKKDVERSDQNIDKFSKLVANPNFSAEILEGLNQLIEKTAQDEDVSSILISMQSILENPNYTSEVAKTVELIFEKPNKDSHLILSALSAIIKNKNYSPDLLKTVDAVIKKYGEKSGGPLHMIRYMIETYNLKVDIGSNNFTEKVFSVSDVIFSNYGNNMFYPFSIFGILARKSSFTEDFFDAAYAEQVSLALKDVSAKGDNVMRAMMVVLLHGHSDLSTFIFAVNLADKTGSSSDRALILMYTALSNENLQPSVCTGKFIDDMAYTVNYMAKQNPGHELDVLLAFQKIIKSPKFKQDMLDTKYSGVLNTVVQKIVSNGQKPFDYESLLENWNKDKLDEAEIAELEKKYKSFGEKYNETYDFLYGLIAGKTKNDSNLDETILALNSIVRNPNFEPGLFDIVRKIVEKTTYEKNTIDFSLDGPITLDHNYTITTAPKSLLDFHDFLFNHSDLSQKELDKILFIIENEGDLDVYDAMLANPTFKPVMLEQQDLDEAKELIDRINQKNSLKTGNKSLEMDSDDLEMLINFSYALNVFIDDKESTKEDKILRLNDERGITYFARYSRKMLNQMYDSLDPEHKKDTPVAYVAFNQNDWNNSFYWKYNELDKLLKYYNVIIFEMDSENEFYKSVEKTANTYGKIESAVLAGHGHVTGINFGSGNNETNDIDTGDEKELRELKEYMVDSPTIILIACSTGHGEGSIGAKLSALWHATVWAPDELTSLDDIIISKNGKIKETDYQDDGSDGKGEQEADG